MFGNPREVAELVSGGGSDVRGIMIPKLSDFYTK